MIDRIGNNISSMIKPSVSDGLEKANEDAKKKFAKDFESLVVNKLFESAEKTMSGSVFGTDAASKQIRGMFWMFLSQDVADKGGVGLADQIYSSLSKMDNTQKSLDHKA